MSELSDTQITRLTQNAEAGKIIRAWCSHPGYGLYKKALEEVLADKKNKWLQGSDEEARTERIRAQGLQKALEILTQFMVVGDSASMILARDNSDQLAK